MRPAAERVTGEDVLIGTLLWIGGTIVVGNAVLIVPVLWILASRLRIESIHWLPIAFAILALANLNLGAMMGRIGAEFTDMTVLLLPIMILAAERMRVQAMKVFCVLMIAEVGVAILESIAGVSTFFPSRVEAYDLGATGLLYDNRVLGFRTNSSLLASNLLIMALCMYRFGLFDRALWRWAGMGAVMIGLFLSFNRAVILAALVFVGLWTLRNIWRLKHRGKVLFVVVTSLSVGYYLSESIITQFMRGIDYLDSSSAARVEYFYGTMALLAEHPLTGNASAKLTFYSSAEGALNHAHNSYMMLFGTHGIPIGLLLVAFVVLRYVRCDWPSRVVVITLASYSVFQYGIFWNLSLMDIVLFRTLSWPGQQAAPDAPPLRAPAAAPRSRASA